MRYLTNCALALGCETSELIEDQWLEWKPFDTRIKGPPEPEQFWRVAEEEIAEH